MSTPTPVSSSVVPDLSLAPRVQQAIAVLGASNAISILRTLDRNGGRLLNGSFSSAMPWMGSSLGVRLVTMEEGGLVARSGSGRDGSVALTEAGREALQIQVPVARWASVHQSRPATGSGPGAYTAQALASLDRRYTVATLWAIASEGEPVYPSEIQDLVLPDGGPHPAVLYQRLTQMKDAGLVVRTGERRAYLYDLTEAGRELLEPLEVLARWAERHVPAPETVAAAVPEPQQAARLAVTSPASAPAATTTSPAALAAARAGAATVRSTIALAFSDSPAPQAAPLVGNPAAAHRR
ncbi:winged helix-turn-helix transcriptional regulator [Kitasatospora sp. NPDC088783]|uniref:winged helix-turn-helix transcriptional regulator n=1 Tax=Kitasatospora sp. NPDC088783 TaxID=3364077 RepID=UPI00382CB83F